MIIATAGHVDHGKTTLLRALTGIDTDRLPEEKARGMSIDLGFAYADIDGQRIGFIDVPGHERFIRNMLAGVAYIDFALLIIAADDGVMPQTLEHLAILDLLGIQQGAVALTKIDRTDPQRIQQLSQEISALLAGTALKDAPVFPVSSPDGGGVSALRNYLGRAADRFSEKPRTGNFRLAIDRAFTLRGIGVTVTGTVFSGRAAIGDMLLLSPLGVRIRVRGIHANNQPTDEARSGQRCAINIAAAGGDSLSHDAIHRGDWLLAVAAHAPSARLDARIRLLAGEPAALKHWTPVHVHIGAAHATGRVALLEAPALRPGETMLVQLVLDRPIGALHGDRIILRDASAQRTIGGGQVIDPFAPGKGRARMERITILHALEKPAPQAAMRELLPLSPGGIELAQFAQTFNLTNHEASELWRELPMRLFGRAYDQSGISEAHYTSLRERIPDIVGVWHQKSPQSLGLNETELRRELRPPVSPVLLNPILKDLLLAGKIARSGTVWRLPGHSVTPSRKDMEDWARLAPLFDSSGPTPPRIRELAPETAKTPEEMEALLARLSQAGLVTRVSKNRFFTPEILRAHAAFAEQAAGKKPVFTAQDYRLLSGIGRNLTIEILEYFDRAGFTRRIQEGRMIRVPAEDIFGA